jgi:6-pyruvoyltetrahydropterin/6-carboxytetrahydropterin synthase
MTFQSTKTYGHEQGLSATFRQWRATSHCNQLHGYALAFRFVFEADELDERNWVVDFGDLKELKQKLQDTFDHKLVVAADDPKLDRLEALQAAGLADVVVVSDVGCERFAEMAYRMAESVLDAKGLKPRVWVASVECFEHGANSAIFESDGTEIIDPSEWDDEWL